MKTPAREHRAVARIVRKAIETAQVEVLDWTITRISAEAEKILRPAGESGERARWNYDGLRRWPTTPGYWLD